MIRFRRLHLRGYRRFHQFSCSFGEGLNIIVGPNESGKSTLLDAILNALYANPFSTAQELRERVRWGHAGGWELELELCEDGQTLSIRKRYCPDDPVRRSECAILEKSLEGKEALQYWEQYWGVPREVYLATACIRQRELNAIASNKKSLAALQQQLRESALMTDLERILKQLQEQVRKLQEQRDIFQQQRQSLLVQLREAEATQARQQEYRLRLHTLAEQIEQYQHHIAQEQAILERWQSLTRTQSELKRVRTEVEVRRRLLDTLERIERDLQRLQVESGHTGSWEQLRTALREQYEAAWHEEQATHRAVEDLVSAHQPKSSPTQPLTERQRLRLGIGIAGVALVLTGVSLIPLNGFLGGIIAGLGGVTLLIALLWRPSSTHEIESQQQHLQQQPTFSSPTHERAQQRRMQAERRLRECEDLLNQRAGLLQAHDPDELRQQFAQLAVRQHALETELHSDPVAQQLLARPAEEWLQRERQLQVLQQELEQAVQEKLRIEGALQQFILEHDPDELRLQLQLLNEQDAYLQRRIELLQTTRELLMEANRRYLSDLRPLLQPRIAALLPMLTCGRYTQVRLGDGLLFQVYHPDADEWLDAEPREAGWSAGTLDQIFFACRLGLSDALTGDRRLPLLLDEPFLAFDDARLQAAMELLTRVAEHTQVLLFTCRLPDSLVPMRVGGEIFATGSEKKTLNVTWIELDGSR